MKKQTKGDPLERLIQEAGLEEPGAEFSRHLTDMVVARHGSRQSYSEKYKRPDWVGKGIIMVLVALNGLMLVELNPFRAQPVLCWAAGGWVVAFFCILVWATRIRKILS